MPNELKPCEMVYVLPFELYGDWKDLMCAKEVCREMVRCLKCEQESKR